MNRNTIESTLYDIHNNQSNNDHILMVQPLKYHDMYMYLRNILIDKLIYFDLLPCNNECDAASVSQKRNKIWDIHLPCSNIEIIEKKQARFLVPSNTFQQSNIRCYLEPYGGNLRFLTISCRTVITDNLGKFQATTLRYPKTCYIKVQSLKLFVFICILLNISQKF